MVRGLCGGRQVADVRFRAGSENQKRQREEDSRKSRLGASHPLRRGHHLKYYASMTQPEGLVNYIGDIPKTDLR